MGVDNSTALDLDGYLARIGYEGIRKPGVGALRDLHLAHATHVPFENVDIHLGRPIRLDLESLQAKLVRGRRGGYCFEHNTLFAAALDAIGFRVRRLAARVRVGTDRILPRTHMLLEVDVEEDSYLADVGFGGGGPLLPVRLSPGEVVRQFDRSYRVVEESNVLVLQSLVGAEWHDQYAFTREPQYPVDFEVANHFTSTHPESIFVRAVTVQCQSPTERLTLRNRDLLIERGGAMQQHTVEGHVELRRVLSERFGLEFTLEEMDRVFSAAVASA